MKRNNLLLIVCMFVSLAGITAGGDSHGTSLTDEFIVNTDTTDADQVKPNIAAPYLIAWEDYRWGSRRIYAQLQPGPFDFEVRPRYLGDDVFTPAVTAKGGDVGIWVENHNGDNDIYLDRPLYKPDTYCNCKKVNSDEGSHDQRNPDIDSKESPYRYIIVWEDNRNGNYEIFGKMYAYPCFAYVDDFQASPYVGSAVNKSNPSVAINHSGDFVVVWEDDRDNGYIYGQRYNSECEPVGNLFQVNDYVAYQHGPPKFPKVGIDHFGNFVVVWVDSRDHQWLQLYDIYAQRYDSSGVPQGGNFRVNQTVASADLIPPAVGMEPWGSFVVTWRRGIYWQGSWLFDIYARKYNPLGVALGDNYKVNTDTEDASQTNPTIAIYHPGWYSWYEDAEIYYAWQDYRIPEKGWDVYAKIEPWPVRYVPGDANGNGIVNSADVTYLINYLFSGGPPPRPLNAGDPNADCSINSADVVCLTNYLFRGGPAPQPGCVE